MLNAESGARRGDAAAGFLLSTGHRHNREVKSMSDVRLRTLFATVCAATLCLALTPKPDAAQLANKNLPTNKTSPILAHFAAKAPYEGDSGAASRIDFMIERWSTDEEVDNLRGALASNGAKGLLPALQKMPLRAGVVLIPGVHGQGARVRLRRPFNVYFARQIKTDKGLQVILGADHYLAFGQPTLDWPEDVEFSLVDIRLGPDGTGVGKVARAGGVAYNKDAKMIEIANYSKAPTQLTEVKAEKAGTAARTAGAKQ
jgi:hypothetical protein